MQKIKYRGKEIASFETREEALKALEPVITKQVEALLMLSPKFHNVSDDWEIDEEKA